MFATAADYRVSRLSRSADPARPGRADDRGEHHHGAVEDHGARREEHEGDPRRAHRHQHVARVRRDELGAGQHQPTADHQAAGGLRGRRQGGDRLVREEHLLDGVRWCIVSLFVTRLD